MNKEWSELNKMMQQQIKKKDSFSEGIETFLLLRKNLWNKYLNLKIR